MTLIAEKCSCGYSPQKINPDCERCRYVWLLNKVHEMRTAQTTYFQTRKASDLVAARRLEDIVDAALKKLKPTQVKLFEE